MPVDSYLEDIVPEIKYRPQFLRSSKKEKDDEQRATREDLVSKGLDDESARAVQAISRADRIDYQVRASTVPFPAPLHDALGTFSSSRRSFVISSTQRQSAVACSFSYLVSKRLDNVWTP